MDTIPSMHVFGRSICEHELCRPKHVFGRSRARLRTEQSTSSAVDHPVLIKFSGVAITLFCVRGIPGVVVLCPLHVVFGIPTKLPSARSASPASRRSGASGAATGVNRPHRMELRENMRIPSSDGVVSSGPSLTRLRSARFSQSRRPCSTPRTSWGASSAAVFAQARAQSFTCSGCTTSRRSGHPGRLQGGIPPLIG